jgi:hypothetical protein
LTRIACYLIRVYKPHQESLAADQDGELWRLKSNSN